jgi:sugar/nucleoside kinase (ribokinase family)
VSAPAASARRVVCLGEALVDLVCERPVAGLGEAPAFVPRLGGSLANIAIAAARFGAPVEMLGGAGDDEWGRWLRDGIRAEGVGVERFVLMPGAGTSHAFVAVRADGEPAFAFYGDRERPAAHAEDDLDPALSGEPGVLVVGSDTLLGAAERAVTMHAVALARGRGWLVVCDPNLRPNRWATREEMLATIRALVAGASVVKCNVHEAEALAGVDGAEAAARALDELGPEVVVVTRGGEGALAVSEGVTEAVGGRDAKVVDTTGAGDSVAGVIAAGLALGADPSPPALAPVLDVAMQTAAGIVAVWGATAGLPAAAEARERLARALASRNVDDFGGL